MSAQAIRRPGYGLPSGARRPLAVVAALFCVASGVPLLSQVDITWTWPETPDVAVHAPPRRAAPPAVATRAGPAFAPPRRQGPLRSADISSVVARPAFVSTTPAPTRVARLLPDDVAPPGTFALHVDDASPALPHVSSTSHYNARHRPRASVAVAPPTTVEPTPAAGPAPTAPPMREDLAYISIASVATHNYNEFSSGQWRPESYMIDGAWALAKPRLALKLDYREDVYVTNDSLVAPSGVHQTRFTTVSGAVTQTPVFYARQSTFDARIEAQVAKPHIYVGVGYLHTTNNYHFPQLNGVGVGVEKLPDFHGPLSVYGSVFYYPAVTGASNVTNPSNANPGTASYQQSYAITKFDVGAILKPVHVPVYIYGGFSGDLYDAKEAAPVNQSHTGAYAGIGMKL